METKETSARIASIAAKLLNMTNPRIITDELWDEIKEVAGSALSQTTGKVVKPNEDIHNAFLRLVFADKR